MSDINAVFTVDELKARLGIDYTDEQIETNLRRAIATADGELRESVGDNYPVDHPLTKELALAYAANSYENGDVLTGNAEKQAEQMALKIRLYMRRAANEQGI